MISSGFASVVARNSLAGIAGQVATKLISFAFTVFVVRGLGGSSFGQYSTILAFLTIFTIFADLGLAPFAVRGIAREPAATVRLFSNVLALRLVLGPIAIALITASALTVGYSEAVVIGILLGSLGLLLYAVQGPLEVVLTANQRLDLVSGLGVINQLLFVLLGTLALIWGYGYYGLIGASLTAVCITTVITAVTVRRTFGIPLGRMVPSSWPRLIQEAIPFAILGVTVTVLQKIDIVLLSILRGELEVAWYSTGYNFVFMLMFFAHSINGALYPSVAREYPNDRNCIGPIIQIAGRYLLVISLPLSVVLSAMSDDIVSLLYGDGFLSAGLVLRIVIWVLPFMFINNLLSSVGLVIGRQWQIAKANAVSAAFNLVANVVFIPTFGYLAATVITVVTEALTMAQYFLILRSSVAFHEVVAGWVKPLVASTCAAVFIVLAHGLGPIPALTGASVAYVSLLIILRTLGIKELQFLGMVLMRRSS